MMKVAVLTLLPVLGVLTVGAGQAHCQSGEAKFKENCAACHADGGNIINPDKTLSRADREKHGVKTRADIISLMRKPGEGMPVFDAASVPEKDAQAIADYIMLNFK